MARPRILGQYLGHDAAEFGREVGPELRQRLRVLVEDGIDHRRLVVPLEGWAGGEEFVHD